jgi:hypothetical protein
LDSPTYRKFEHEYNKEKLHMMISCSLLLAHLSAISLFFGTLIYKTPPVCFYLIGVSVMFCITSALIWNHCRKFAWDIDYSAEKMTDELIDDSREKLLSGYVFPKNIK